MAVGSIPVAPPLPTGCQIMVLWIFFITDSLTCCISGLYCTYVSRCVVEGVFYWWWWCVMFLLKAIICVLCRVYHVCCCLFTNDVVSLPHVVWLVSFAWWAWIAVMKNSARSHLASAVVGQIKDVICAFTLVMETGWVDRRRSGQVTGLWSGRHGTSRSVGQFFDWC